MKRAIIALVLMGVGIGSGREQNGSEWREQIDLTRVLADSAALNKLVIIYRPTYRQTLFLYGTGRIVLQTYPTELYSRNTALLPTCTGEANAREIREIVTVMIDSHFFDLPQKSFVDTGEHRSEVEFERTIKARYIIVDDGSSRAYRAFAEGSYHGKAEQIPTGFATVEAKLARVADGVAENRPCSMARYMEWRRLGRGETPSDSGAKN